MKKLLAGAALLLSLQTGMAQSLEKMQWFNEPEQWEIKDKTLSLFVTPQSDYWRISHYGFTVDDAPLLCNLRRGIRSEGKDHRRLSGPFRPGRHHDPYRPQELHQGRY